MKKIRNTIQLLSIPMLVCLVAFTQVNAQDGNLTAIGNPKGAPSNLRLTDLKSVMLGEMQRWRDGTKISIALMKTTTSAGELTSKKIYGMTVDELNKFWLALVFQGKAKAPVFFSSSAELENYVAQTPGAIGIVEETQDVKSKPLMIDGKKIF